MDCAGAVVIPGRSASEMGPQMVFEATTKSAGVANVQLGTGMSV